MERTNSAKGSLGGAAPCKEVAIQHAKQADAIRQKEFRAGIMQFKMFISTRDPDRHVKESEQWQVRAEIFRIQ